MTPYTIYTLKQRLIFITWTRNPKRNEAIAFIARIKTLLDEAIQPLYMISDLRYGRIIDVDIINQLSQLSKHPKWAGTTAFTRNPISRLFVGTFRAGLPDKRATNTMFDEPEQALAFLEALEPGLTAGIDWDALLSQESRTS